MYLKFKHDILVNSDDILSIKKGVPTELTIQFSNPSSQTITISYGTKLDRDNAFDAFYKLVSPIMASSDLFEPKSTTHKRVRVKSNCSLNNWYTDFKEQIFNVYLGTKIWRSKPCYRLLTEEVDSIMASNSNISLENKNLYIKVEDCDTVEEVKI